MKYKIISGFLFAAIFSVVLLTGSRTAAQPGAAFGHGFGGPRMFQGLQLSDTQKSSIQELFASNREKLRPLHEQVQQQRRLLQEATEKQPFDESQVRFQAQELAKLQAEMMVAHAALMNQVTAILTPEQRATLSALKAERREHFKERRQHQRGKPESRQG
jgi:Spy/CpxP family protein refolding chaperone